MSKTPGKILVGLGVPILLVGTYAIWWSSMRGWFKPSDAMQGCIIGGVGLTMVSIGIAILKRPLAGIATFAIAAGLAAFVVHRGSSRAADEQAILDAQRLLAETFWPVCERGAPVARAAPRSSTGPRPAVLITDMSERGGHYYWYGDERWFPSSVEATQLVACFFTEKTTVDACSYDTNLGPRTIPSTQYIITAKLYAAKTAELIAERKFTGSPPGKCPEAIRRKANEVPRAFEGGMPPNEDLVAFVRAHVEDAERADPRAEKK